MPSINISISMRPEDLVFYEKFGDLAKKEGFHSASAYLVDLMKKELKEHSESHNPQTIIDMFDRDIVTAIPNLYERDEDKWLKFYGGLSPKEYEALGERLDWLGNLHNSAKILL